MTSWYVFPNEKLICFTQVKSVVFLWRSTAPLFITWRKAVSGCTDYTVATLASAVFIIMADTQQKINRVIVDLIKVISPQSCLMLRESARLISWRVLSFSAVQFVAQMLEGSIHGPLKLSKDDWERRGEGFTLEFEWRRNVQSNGLLIEVGIRFFCALVAFLFKKRLWEYEGEYKSNWSGSSSPQHHNNIYYLLSPISTLWTEYYLRTHMCYCFM